MTGFKVFLNVDFSIVRPLASENTSPEYIILNRKNFTFAQYTIKQFP